MFEFIQLLRKWFVDTEQNIKPHFCIEFEMASITTLNDLIEKLHQLFEDDVVDVDHVMQVFNSYKSNPAEWKKFAKFDRYRSILKIKND